MNKFTIDNIKEAIGHLKDARICLLVIGKHGIKASDDKAIADAEGFIGDAIHELSKIRNEE